MGKGITQKHAISEELQTLSKVSIEVASGFHARLLVRGEPFLRSLGLFFRVPGSRFQRDDFVANQVRGLESAVPRSLGVQHMTLYHDSSKQRKVNT